MQKIVAATSQNQPQAFDDLARSWGWPRFRADQVRDWVYRKLVTDPQAMIPGAIMPYKQAKPELRTAIVSYLKELH